MKALLVGDNSSNLNWGGRGASIALNQLLSEKFQITGTIPGTSFILACAGFGYVNTILPPRYNWLLIHLQANRHRRKVFDYYCRLEEFFGAKDFIAHDPAETVHNILRYKSKVREIQEIYEKANNSDVVVVNGEGDLVFTSPPRRTALFLLGLAELGLQLKKNVVFVNALVSDPPSAARNPETFEFARRTLSRCHAVIVRDYQSLEYVRTEMPSADCRLVPDSLFAWHPIMKNAGSKLPANGDFILPYPELKSSFGKLDFSRPYVCIGGSALAGRDREKSVKHFSILLRKVRELGYPVYLTENCIGDSFLQTVAENEGAGLVPASTAIFMCGAILANARLFISGRYHPSILASLGGTPCIFLGSSAHKMYSLQKLLEYDYIREFPLYSSAADLDEIFELARSYLSQGQVLRRSIEAVARKRCDEAMRLSEIIFDRVVSAMSRAICPS